MRSASNKSGGIVEAGLVLITADTQVVCAVGEAVLGINTRNAGNVCNAFKLYEGVRSKDASETAAEAFALIAIGVYSAILAR